MNSDAAVPGLNRNIAYRQEIPLPPLNIQRKIASILSAYDDLIENNTRRIKILEEMAQLIYREWFIDFEFPVELQSQPSPPTPLPEVEGGNNKKGHLFPSTVSSPFGRGIQGEGHFSTKGYKSSGGKMIDSELGKIPEGWEVGQLANYVDFERGVEPGSDNYERCSNKENVPFLRVGDLGNRSIEIFINQSLTKNKILKEDDIVVSMDGTPGIVRMGLFGCYSTGIRKLIIKNNIMKKSFLYFLMMSDHIQNIIKAHSKGTTILHASESIKNMDFILPENHLMKLFDDMVNPMIREILLLNKKNKVLRQTRDLLLPKLISGELDVSELEIVGGRW